MCELGLEGDLLTAWASQKLPGAVFISTTTTIKMFFIPQSFHRLNSPSTSYSICMTFFPSPKVVSDESHLRGVGFLPFFFIETSPQPPNHFYKVSVKLPLCRFENSFDPCSLNLKFQVNFLLRRPPFPTRSICYYSLRSRCFTLANDTQTVRGGVSAFLFKFRVYPYTSPLKSRKINF